MNQTPTPPDAPTKDRPGGLNGRWLVAATLSLIVIVPLFTTAVWKLTENDKQIEPLDYNNRQNWQAQRVSMIELEYDMFVAAEAGRKYKGRTDLQISPEDEAMLRDCVAMAQRADFFTREANLDKLLSLSDQHPMQFYPTYLASELSRWAGHREEAAALRIEAFTRATGAIVQRLSDDQGTPAAGHELPALAIAFDRVEKGELDSNLMLVYPAPAADEHGEVFLPVFYSVYRLADPTLPPGAQPGVYPVDLTLIPQTPYASKPIWFTAPHRVARLPDATVQTAGE